MKRVIYRVDAYIIDGTGAYHGIDGYPKNFDSNNYGNDVEKTKRRAEGDFSSVWSDMCTKDNRMIQTVTLCTIDGNPIDRKSTGTFPDNSANT